MTNAELKEAAQKARDEAARYGSMHGMWDVIFDAEAILQGKPSIAPRDAVERLLTEFLTKIG